MKLLFLGDSITEGVGASCYEKCYVSLVGRKLGCEVVNYGVGGTRIARQEYVHNWTIWNYDFRLRVQIMDKSADKVFVFGGTNDYGHGRLPLGKTSDKDVKTFCSELKLLIEELLAKYKKEKLCFILPLRRFDEDGVCCKGESGNEKGATLFEYVCAMRGIIEQYGIDVLDLYENGIAKPCVNTGDEFTADGVHPNDKGYEIVAEKICEYIKNKGE